MNDNTKNQQLSTELNPYESLDEPDKLAVDMACENVPYKYIAQKMKVQRQTVRTWFMKGGRLYDALNYQRKELRREYKKNFKQINQQIEDAAVEAIVTLRTAVKKSSMTGVVAAKDILDRAGFKPADKVELENKTPIKVEITVDTIKPDGQKFKNQSPFDA